MATIPVDSAIQRLLNDKLYDKRKQGALEYGPIPNNSAPTSTKTDREAIRIERIVRDAVLKDDYTKVQTVLEHLCHEYAYAVHQPHARNGGLIGLAALSIALGAVRLRRTYI